MKQKNKRDIKVEAKKVIKLDKVTKEIEHTNDTKQSKGDVFDRVSKKPPTTDLKSIIEQDKTNKNKQDKMKQEIPKLSTDEERLKRLERFGSAGGQEILEIEQKTTAKKA